MVKVLIAAVLCLTATALYADSTDTKVGSTQNAVAADVQESRRIDSIERITRFMDRGATNNIENMIEQHLSLHPDDSDAYGQLSRIIMKRGAISDRSLLGYRISDEADTRALEALNAALTLDPNNAKELARIGYLHAVKGRYVDASAAFDKVRQLNETPAWLNYNEAIMHAGLEEFSQAAALLQPLTRKRPADGSGNVAWSIYRSAWSLRTAIALRDPKTDAVPAVSRGLITRIPIEKLFDEAVRDVSSGKPVIIFLSSSDNGCPPCVKDVAALEEAAEVFGDDYELMYSSVEPWNDIQKQTILLRGLKLRGLPSQVLMYRGKFLGAVMGETTPKKFKSYMDLLPKIRSGKQKAVKLKHYHELLKLDINSKIKASIEKQANFRAAAIAKEGRAWQSGITGGHGSQAEANDAAMARCARNAKNQGLTVKCSLYSVSK